MAERMFHNFHLDNPVWLRTGTKADTVTSLRKLPTSDTSHLTNFLLDENNDGIGFVDLASDSAGDDWALITRMASLLEDRANPLWPRHLLIIDAVEGLETLAGETDAYGEKVSRRARIALLMRLASHKCHLALVVEESKLDIRLPEEFVADIVIRLRSTLVNGYTRRTLEIEKARGQAHHARGQHPFQIRSGSPAHIRIYPSLHYQGNSMRERIKENDAKANAEESSLVSFGIQHLDNLLSESPDGTVGLRAGLPFAIIGDKGTFKSDLADAFLSQCFVDIAQSFCHAELDPSLWRDLWKTLAREAGVAVLCSSTPRRRSDLVRSLTNQIVAQNPRACKFLASCPKWILDAFNDWMLKETHSRLQLDTLVIQDQPGPRLFHRISNLISNAKKAAEQLTPAGSKKYHVRFVIDDMSAFRDAYPELHEDPLLLPLVVQLSRLERVSTLLVATQSIQLDGSQHHGFDSALRSSVEGYLLTWRVSFFGKARTAVTFVAGSESDKQSTVREIIRRPAFADAKFLATQVDPEFELYDELETGRPIPVPLEIRAYVETSAFQEYVNRENELLKEVFHASGHDEAKKEIIVGVSCGKYDALRDYCYLNASSKLPKTLLLQVDEFWRPARRLGLLADLQNYLSAVVAGDDADPQEDFYSVFQLSGSAKRVQRAVRIDEYPSNPTRRDFFPEFRQPGPPSEEEIIDRVPFMWDFGFLLLSHNDWYASAQSHLPILSKNLGYLLSASPHGTGIEPLKSADFTIGTVMDALRKPGRPLQVRSKEEVQSERSSLKHLSENRSLFRGPSSWRAVLEATTEVRRRRTARDTTTTLAFDVARPSDESFSSFVLEIWLSEILERYSWRIRKSPVEDLENTRAANEVLRKLNSFSYDDQFTLQELLERFPLELYMAWMLLVESINLDSLVDRDKRFSLNDEIDPSPAMAVRHWYKTAAAAKSALYSGEPALPVRLPGYFSVRGDWYLAMAAGSRSYRLGTRALDLLNSRRANIGRLQQGLGLPVRDIVDPKIFDRFRTKLSYINYRGRRATVDYEALVGLGAESTRSYLNPDSRPSSPDPGIDLARMAFGDIAESGDSFFWIWRSRIRDYDHHARIWAKWLVRITLLMGGLKNELAPSWESGYEIYDSIAINDGVPREVSELRSYDRFMGMIEFLKGEIRWTASSR
jgi:KaiC/GvpD/RAD55 family RecA-like ATPase